jgi:hypothetical protein
VARYSLVIWHHLPFAPARPVPTLTTDTERSSWFRSDIGPPSPGRGHERAARPGPGLRLRGTPPGTPNSPGIEPRWRWVTGHRSSVNPDIVATPTDDPSAVAVVAIRVDDELARQRRGSTALRRRPDLRINSLISRVPVSLPPHEEGARSVGALPFAHVGAADRARASLRQLVPIEEALADKHVPRRIAFAFAERARTAAEDRPR